jgi:hypothetical protein
MENLTIPENTTLVTMDVTSLYTNIPHVKEGPFGFRHIVCEFYRRLDTVGMFKKFIKLFIAMYPLHVKVIYKSEP